MGGTPDTTTTVTKQDPWAGQMPYLQDVFSQARGLFEGPGPGFYPGQTVAGFTPEQMQAMSATASRATMGSPLNTAAQGNLLGLVNAGIPGNPAIGGLQDVGSGSLNTSAANPAYNALTNAGQGPGQDFLGQLMGGQFSGGPGSAWYGSAGSSMNPAMGGYADIASTGGFNTDDIFKAVQAKVQPAIASQYSAAGRTPTGSNTYAENLAKGLTEGFAPYALQASQANIGNRLAGLSGLAGLGESAFGRQFQAGQGLQGIYQQGLSNRLTGQQGLQGQFQNQLQNMLAGGQLGLSQAGLNAGNQLQGLQGLGNIYNQTLPSYLQALGMAPQMAQTDYGDIQQLYNVGSQLQGMNQQQINADLARYNYGQQLPYNQLANYANMIQGNYGGTQTTTQPYTGPSTGQQILGGLLGLGGLATGFMGIPGLNMFG